MNRNRDISRRDVLRHMAVCAAGGMTAGMHPFLTGCNRAASEAETTHARQSMGESKRRYLVVVGASGGASIIDSFMAIRESEAGSAAPTLNCFPDNEVVDVSGTPFRAVNTSTDTLGPIPIFGTLEIEQESFVEAHAQDMLVSTLTASSVNHAVAQQRSVTGGGAWNGRTLQEMVALTYGADLPLANVQLTSGTGFAARGADDSLPSHAYGVPVADPVLWPVGLHGSRGVANAPSRDLLEIGRKLRNEGIDSRSKFLYTFDKSPALKRWLEQRKAGLTLEERDLITKLMVLPDSAAFPLGQYGLDSSPDGAQVREVFPDYETNPVEAQAALSFLLLKHNVSCAVTIAPAFDLSLGAELDLTEGVPEGVADFIYNLPLAFDFSHTGHRASQAFMWKKTLGLVDRLVHLLKTEPAPDNSGDTLWDRTLLYVATDFGREKTRPDTAIADWSTGHEAKQRGHAHVAHGRGKHVARRRCASNRLHLRLQPQLRAVRRRSRDGRA